MARRKFIVSEHIGQEYNHLTIIEQVPHERITQVLCRCRCGKTRVINISKVVDGVRKSCGCSRYYFSRQTKNCYPEGYREWPEYPVWKMMIARCKNKKSKSYKNYGGRGITVCKSWRQDFRVFIADMGRRPSDKHTLDRVNNDGNYCPENCRWATRLVQNNNRRDNFVVCCGGVAQSVSQWSRDFNRSSSTIFEHIKKKGVVVAMALFGKNVDWYSKAGVKHVPDCLANREL